MSSVETGQMSAVETGQMSAAETGQMSAVETRQMLKSQTRRLAFPPAMELVQSQAKPKSWLTRVPVGAKNIKSGPEGVKNPRFGVKLGPNEAESTPRPFPNPPGPQNPIFDPKIPYWVPGVSFGSPFEVFVFSMRRYVILEVNPIHDPWRKPRICYLQPVHSESVTCSMWPDTR